MSTSDDLVREARQGRRQISSTPRQLTAVVTCMDTRLEPLRMLKASPGDLHIIRNAGGVVTADVVRSLVASTHSFGVTMVKLIMHTDCGMLGLDQGKLEADLGPIPFDMGGFTDLKEELRRGAERLQSEPLLNLSGGVVPYIYDVREATLRRQ